MLTAAHCLYFRGEKLTKYDYLEIRAGIQRLFSFSPTEQAIRVNRSMIHEKYNRKSELILNICYDKKLLMTLFTAFENDVALLELENTLEFNKWVQPICIPTSESVGDSTDRGWILGPHDSTCKIVRKFCAIGSLLFQF